MNVNQLRERFTKLSIDQLVVLLDHCYPVALADAVVNAWHLDFQLAELAALCAVVLGAGVEAVDLLVGGVGDQRHLADRVVLGELRPRLYRVLDGLIPCVCHVELSA